MTIKDLIKNFTDACKEKGYTMYYNNEYGVDLAIFELLPDATTGVTVYPVGSFKPVDSVNGTSEKIMSETAIKLNLSQAIVKFTDMVKSGEFDKNGTYRIIFLNETSNCVPLGLVCNRNSGGELRLNVREVRPDRRWDGAGSAWFDSNETLEPVTQTDMWVGGYRGRFVIPQQALETSDTLTLDQAIKICKDNGLKVIKTITQEIEM